MLRAPTVNRFSNACIIANSLIESFSNPLKGVFVGCGRITGKPDLTHFWVGEGWPTILEVSRSAALIETSSAKTSADSALSLTAQSNMCVIIRQNFPSAVSGLTFV